MIRDIIELLQFQEWNNTTENIHIAKGGYRFPRTFKEHLKQGKRWLSQRL